MENSLSQLASAKTSFFSSVLSKTPQQECTLADVIQTIRSDELADQVTEIRNALDAGRAVDAARLKHRLPAVTTSVVTLARDASLPADQRFGAHNGFLQIDLDAKDNPQLATAWDDIVKRLKEDKHVAAGFRSPSGNGLKLFFAIRDSKTAHKLSWIAAQEYFKTNYGLAIDRATSDVGRLCFLSYDPEAWVSTHATEPLPPAADEAVVHSSARSTLSEIDDIEEMLSFITYRPEYEDWLRIASAVWNTVGEADGTALLKKFIPEETAGEYEKKYAKRLTTITLGTLVHYASLQGYDVRAAAARKRWAGRIYFGRDGQAVSSEVADARAEAVQSEANEYAPVAITPLFIDECFRRQQRGDAELFAVIQRGIYEFDHLSMCWRHYADGIWTRDDTSTALIDLQDTIAGAYRERIKIYENDIRAGDESDPAVKSNKKAIDLLTKRINQVFNKQYATAVLSIASSLLASKATGYDANPYLCVCKNKTIDLALGEARQHSPKDHVTIALNAEFDPDATCPKWEQFMQDIFLGDQDLINYMQRVVGYCLSGKTSEDVMFFCIGSGANGKSTFRSALEMLFGEYSSSIKISALLTQTSDSNVDYQKATMKGRRIVWTDEVPEGKRFNESQIKAMVGGDKILARAIFERPFEFEPTHKLFPIGNHVPTITGTDNGIWRRIVLVPFGATFGADKTKPRRDRFEILRDFQQEMPGILNWALQGWLDYSVRGLKDKPQAVQEATQKYRDSQDQIACFLEECYDRMDSPEFYKIKAQDLFEVYNNWCQSSGEVASSKTRRHFMTKIREQGLPVKQSSGGFYYVLGLKRKQEVDAPVISGYSYAKKQEENTFSFYEN